MQFSSWHNSLPKLSRINKMIEAGKSSLAYKVAIPGTTSRAPEWKSIFQKTFPYCKSPISIPRLHVRGRGGGNLEDGFKEKRATWLQIIGLSLSFMLCLRMMDENICAHILSRFLLSIVFHNSLILLLCTRV